MSETLIRILAIDGGGIRGLIPSMLLAEAERATGRPMHESFDVIAGTSTGSLIAAMLTVPMPGGERIRSSPELVDYYLGPDAQAFFQRSEAYKKFKENHPGEEWTLPQYPAESHKRGVELALDNEVCLSQARTHLTIPYFDMSFKPPRARTFTRRKARLDPQAEEFRMVRVIRAASTFPGYFPTWVLRRRKGPRIRPLDGGVFAINPALGGLAHAIRLLPQIIGSSRLDPSDFRFLVVSLGTGYHNTVIRGSRCDPMRSWGVSEWAAPLMSVMWEGQSSFVDQQLTELFPQRKLPLFGQTPFRYYRRFQARMERDIPFYDGSPEALEELQKAATEMIERDRGALDEVIGLLEGPKMLD